MPFLPPRRTIEHSLQLVIGVAATGPALIIEGITARSLTRYNHSNRPSRSRCLTRRKRPIGKPLSILLLALPAAARGQDALFSALSLDKSVSPQTNAIVDLSRAQSHIGPVQANTSAFVAMSYDDNINQAQFSPESDFIFSLGTTLDFIWPATDQSELRFGSGISYLNYLRSTQNSGLQITPDSALTYSVTIEDWQLTAFDQFSYQREVVTEAALANVTTLPRLNNTAGLRAEWDPGKWTLQTGYSHSDNISTGSAANDFLNYSSEYFFGRAGRRLAEQTEFGVEASGSLTSYESASQNDSQSASFGAYADWQLRPAIHLELRGGPTLYFFNKSSAGQQTSALNSYYLVVQVSHQINDYLSQSLNIERDVQLGLNPGSSYIEQLSIYYSPSWQLTHALAATFTVTYESGNQPLGSANPPFIVSENENYSRYGGGFQFSWQANDRLRTNLSYSFWNRQSNIAGRAYTENLVSLGATYTF